MSGQGTPGGSVWFDGGARLVAVERHIDARGALLPVEFDRLPFAPKRLFTVSGVPAGTVRGGHAHRQGQQFLVCLQGRVELHLRRGDDTADLALLPDGPGLLVGPLVWCEQTYALDGTVLLVLSSEPYDPESYLAQWDGA